MTTDQDKCGLRSLHLVSCRNRTETFARHLQSRLNSLGSQNSFEEDENTSPPSRNNNSNNHNASLDFLDGQNSTDTDVYYEFSPPQSPVSPEEEVKNLEFHKVINRSDNLQPIVSNNEYHQHPIKVNNLFCSNNKTPSNDSDSSDGTFYDLESELEQNLVNGGGNGLNENIINIFMNGANPADFDNAGVLSSKNHCKGVSDFCSKTKDDSLPFCNGISKIEFENSETNNDNDVVFLNHETFDKGVEERDPPVKSESFSCHDISTHDIANVSCNCEKDDNEIYCSTLNVEKDLKTVECPDITNGCAENGEKEINGCTEDGECPDITNGCAEGGEKEINGCTEDGEKEMIDDDGISSQEKVSNGEDNKPEDNEDILIEGTIPRVRRCSSLKTGKTPPGTPGRKKIVRFADVLGLDLADVRTFLDEIPKVPNSAYDDLQDADFIESQNNSFSSLSVGYQGTTATAQKLFVPLFQQPGGQTDFLEKVRENFVCLENAVVEDPISLYISGTVRVRNLDFHKSVHVRYTLDSWRNYADVQATYVPNSCDGFSDKFSFVIYAHPLAVGQQLEFAVRFSCKGCQFWDSNNGINYRFECLPTSSNLGFVPIIGSNEHDWGVSFY